MKKLDIPEEELQRMYWDEGMSTPHIARVFGCSKRCVLDYMVEYGISRRTLSEAHLPIEMPHSVLEGMYCEQEMSMSEIGKHFGCAASVVRRRMVGYNIPRRTLSEARTGEKNPFFGKTHTADVRSKLSSVHRGKIIPDEQRRKMSESLKGKKMGAENPAWKGGIKYLPYCSKFNETFKESIRDKFNRTCFLCPTTEQEQLDSMRSQGKKAFRLAVHHVNYNKDCLCDDSICEFVPLCLKCHGKVDHNREHWEETIMDKLEVMKCESRL